MYKDMLSILQPGKIGDFELSHFDVEHSFYAIIRGIPEGRYVRMTHNGEVVMSNTPMEMRTNNEFVHSANGDVLIGGLGLGMIILAIQDKKCVKSILVVEKYQEVIDLVAHQLPLNDKVTIIKGDVTTWKPEPGQKFDTVYMDIWNSINRDVYDEEMKPLKRKFGQFLKPKDVSPERFNKCWAEYNAKNEVELR